AFSREYRVRILARRGFLILLTSCWLPRALAPGMKSPIETRSGPRRDDSLLQTACGCPAFAVSVPAGLRTTENPAGNRALRPRSSTAAAPAPPETSFETRLPRAGAWAEAWSGPVPAAHCK